MANLSRWRPWIVIALASLSWGEGQARARDPVDTEALVELRLTVEDLAAQLRAQREQTLGELAAIRTDKEELARQLRMAKARRETLERIEQEHRAAARAHQAEAEQWSAPSRAALEAARAAVRRSLPFQVESRLATLERIEAELVGHGSDVARAMERLWRFLEEEEAMTAEVVMSRQAVRLTDAQGHLEEKPRLVEVLRFGMALLYLRTREGEVGWARKVGSGWVFELLADPISQSIVRALFEQHERNETFGPSELLLPPDPSPQAGPA